jgi:hypothetical protein
MVIQDRGKAVVQPNFAYILKQRCWGKNEKKEMDLPKLSSRFHDFFYLDQTAKKSPLNCFYTLKLKLA